VFIYIYIYLNNLFLGKAVGTSTGNCSNVQLSINGRSTEKSDWAFSEVVVWDRILPYSEMKKVSDAMLLSLCGTTYYWSSLSNTCVLCPANSTSSVSSCSCTESDKYWHPVSNVCKVCPEGSSYSNNSCTCVGNTYFDMLSGSCLGYYYDGVNGSVSSPWGIWRAQSYNLNFPYVLIEARGNGRDARFSGSGITTSNSSGSGAINSVYSLNGGTSLTMQWPTLPNEFTICSLTRYTSSSSTNRQRILTNTGTSCEWFHGHHNNKRGVAFYNGWRTFEMSFGTSTDWLVMCGQNSQSNSDAIPKNIIADGCSTI
jgi:hypothetical protein